jgi:cyclopropane-fatty-acyl-phospholipid synthase
VRLLANLFSGFVQKGELRVIDWRGRRHVFRGREGGPSVSIALHDGSLEWRLFINPELAGPEAYVDGTLTLEDGSSLDDLLALYWHNNIALASYPTQRALRRLWKAGRWLQQRNSIERAKRQARRHYDLSTGFYRLFLDEGLNYSCAYFHSPGRSLEEAQRAKHVHAIAKLGLEPGMEILEIGGGWGSFAIELARAGARVTSLNVSREQVAVATDRASQARVGDRVRFVLQDYREFTGGDFDRVVSVGMMEHVGARYLKAYFAAVRDCLKPDGYALIHSIGRIEPPGTTSPFLRKYIFPGGYAPALSETLAAVEHCGLWCADLEIFRLHYYYTIRHWQRRFRDNRDQARALYDERFCRIWEFYLAAVAHGFLYGELMVFQVLLSKTCDAVPITRDFMVDEERRLNAPAARVNA